MELHDVPWSGTEFVAMGFAGAVRSADGVT
jgi:hypothetical protein